MDFKEMDFGEEGNRYAVVYPPSGQRYGICCQGQNCHYSAKVPGLN